MFHVATFGTNGFFKTVVSNHNETQHETIEGAREQLYKDVIALLARNWHMSNPTLNMSQCEAADEGVKLYRYDDTRIVGIWEA